MENKNVASDGIDNISTQERLSHLSNVKFKFYFSPHGNYHDFKGLFTKLKDADIYIPEVYGWSQDYLKMYQDISEGKKTPADVIRENQVADTEANPLLLEELCALYKTKKPILFIDLSEEQLPLGHNKIFLSSQSFNGLLANVQYYLQKESKLNQKRERYMAEQLKMRVDEILDSHPELKAKDNVDVLISLGSVHTGVYYQLKDAGFRVDREFNEMPQVYSLTDEGVRRYMLGRPVDQELAARILLEAAFGEVFQSQIERISIDNTKIELFKRKVASKFGINEIMKIFHTLTFTDWNYFKGSFEGYMKYKMETKGLKIPESEQELDNMITS